ncbi:MAG TPA: cytochrome c3 family protein, partial [Candidatus Binatia bacterium]|nr:cytochrome c3 family protein [Candidatus Binatia bacterium]
MGGYEYDGKAYDALFKHVEPYSTCIDCHDPHTLEVQVEGCSSCHAGVESVEDLPQIRTLASAVDYDGDGNMDEGVLGEIQTLQEMLYQALQAYGSNVLEAPLVYNSDRHPYFFVDANANGEVDEGDTETYASWTPRLVKAAYNYQVSLKDPGNYAHGGKYIIELLYDSIEDLNQSLDEPIDLSNAQRIDHGHFAGSEEAFRHWDEEGSVPATCSKCHSAEGLPFFLTEGVLVSQELSNGLECTTCHSSLETFERRPVEEVAFPSGAVLSTGDPDSNICINCHQGRESTVSVDRLIGDTGDDEMAEGLRFLNVHYFAAGATLFGGEAQGAYQFEGQQYAGRNEHVPAFDSCIECHNTHALEVEVEACGNCHEGVETEEDLVTIRFDPEGDAVDYDGDGDVQEGIAMEIATLREALYTAMQEYATSTLDTGIIYDGASYPYFFADADGDGQSDGDAFNSWTPRLLRAAYNYQYVTKDPGAFAHNNEYTIQILYDSLNHLGADVSNYVRPPVPSQ